jgi:hypothetical protein
LRHKLKNGLVSIAEHLLGTFSAFSFFVILSNACDILIFSGEDHIEISPFSPVYADIFENDSPVVRD